MMKSERLSKSWTISVSIFGSTIVKKQLFLAIGFPTITILAILIIASEGNIVQSGVIYFIYILMALFILTYIFIKLVYKGKTNMSFILDDTGISFGTSTKEQKKTRVLGNLTMILGLLSKSPGAISAGYVSRLNQQNYIKWKDINKISYYPKDSLIYVKENFASKIAIHCHDYNYDDIKQIIEYKTGQVDSL